MTEERKGPDPFAGVPGGLTDRKGQYPLADRLAGQGYDVDARPTEVVQENYSEQLKEVENIPDSERNLTDPPGQPITSPSEPRTVKVPQESIIAGSPPGDPAPVSGMNPRVEGELDPAEWDNFTSHAQVDGYIDDSANGLSRPPGWYNMTIDKKKAWLDENA